MNETSFYRIIDANANRLREGLRVIEEWARFGVDDRSRSTRIKRMRQSLTRALGRLERVRGVRWPETLLAARDSRSDVGRDAAGAGRRREGLAPLLAANFKRVQEAARVLEEYAALYDASASAQFEAIRYAAYDLETEWVPAWIRSDRMDAVSVCVVVTESVARRSVIATTRAVLRGGAEMIQYRNKELDDGEFANVAACLLSVCRRADVPLILNDRVHVAAAVGADGVHLGERDLPPDAARRVLGAAAIIGTSAATLARVRWAQREPVDYIGVGAVFDSPTKQKTGGRAARTRGTEFLAKAYGISGVPLLAIGGIGPTNVAEVAATGCRRVAVCSAILAATDPAAVVRRLKRKLRSAKAER